MFPSFLLRVRSLPALCIVCLLSCSTPPSSQPLMLKAFREGVDNSTRTINYHNEVLYYQLRLTAIDSLKGIKVRLWMPRIDSVWACTIAMSGYLDTLENELAAKRDAAGIRGFSERRGPELYRRLMAHRERLLAIDPLFAGTFRGKRYFLPDSGCYKNEPAFMASFFSDAAPGAAGVALAQVRNGVQIMCDKLLTFCEENTRMDQGFFYYVEEPLMSLSSSAVRAGEPIEVTAGIGSFSRRALPEIIINGAKTPLREEGFARYRLKASAKPGRHTVHVRLQYRDVDGKTVYRERDLQYTVIGNDRNGKDSL